MKQQELSTRNAPGDGRGLSQAIFVLIGLGIIAASLWSLYMGDAPYHPDDQVSRGSITLAAD